MRQVEKYTFKKGGNWYYYDVFSFVCEFKSKQIIKYLNDRQMNNLRPSYDLKCALAYFNNLDTIRAI